MLSSGFAAGAAPSASSHEGALTELTALLIDATNGGKKGDTEPHGGQPSGLAPLPGGSGWIETANGKPLWEKGKGETEVGLGVEGHWWLRKFLTRSGKLDVGSWKMMVTCLPFPTSHFPLPFSPIPPGSHA
jgi:hypothetical protein